MQFFGEGRDNEARFYIVGMVPYLCLKKRGSEKGKQALNLGVHRVEGHSLIKTWRGNTCPKKFKNKLLLARHRESDMHHIFMNVFKSDWGVGVHFCSKGQCLFTPLATPPLQAQVGYHPHQVKRCCSIPLTQKNWMHRDLMTAWFWCMSKLKKHIHTT